MKTALFSLFILSQVILNGQDFTKIDAHVAATPQKAERDINSLVKYLHKEADTDIEKVRAYYVWICNNIAYDTRAYFSYSVDAKVSAEETFNRKKSVCQGYSELFNTMCKLGGIQSYMVSGYSKGYSYQSNKSLLSSDHAWNVVKLNNQWFLIDATWGAGHLNEQNRFVKRFEEQFFLADPKLFVLKHLPQDPMWQLLNCPVSISEYRKDDASLSKIVASKDSCFSFNDTIAYWESLKPDLQMINSGERANRFNPLNVDAAGYAYMNYAFEYANKLENAYNSEDYKYAMELNKTILENNEKAYSYLKQSKTNYGKNAAKVCKQNISSMKQNIRSLEKFLK